MKIARFDIHGRHVISLDTGDGFIDYVSVLEARGFGSEVKGTDPEFKIIQLIKRGMFDERFITEQLEWITQNRFECNLDVDAATPLLPHRPNKIVCMARNWAAHAREGGNEPPTQPIFFAKTDNCAIGYGEPIVLPTGVGRVDHEGELGIVISKTAKKVLPENAEDHILGYTIINDVTAREFQKHLSSNRLPWFAAKSMDTFAPIGPWIVLRNSLSSIDERSIQVTVNGEIKQSGTLGEMNWKVPEIIEVITENITLNPGDIVAAGTPPGVGPIKSGDLVKVTIDGIGELSNPVVDTSI